MSRRQFKKEKIITAYNVREGTLRPISEETMHQMRAEGQEAQPLLSEHELIAEMRALFEFLPVALQILQLSQDNAVEGLGREHLHVLGHIVALAMCLRYKQPLNDYEGEHAMICKLLQEMGVD